MAMIQWSPKTPNMKNVWKTHFSFPLWGSRKTCILDLRSTGWWPARPTDWPTSPQRQYFTSWEWDSITNCLTSAAKILDVDGMQQNISNFQISSWMYHVELQSVGRQLCNKPRQDWLSCEWSCDEEATDGSVDHSSGGWDCDRTMGGTKRSWRKAKSTSDSCHTVPPFLLST